MIHPYNINISNIPEDKQFITCMTPTGFIHGKDESRCYVNLSFQVYFSISISESWFEYWSWKNYWSTLWQWSWLYC